MTMQTRKLGRSGRIVSRIGLGLAALGRPGYINLGRVTDFPDRSETAMRLRCWAVLDAARAAGITYFDAARSYGLAEDFLATWRDSRTPEDIVIGSKWGYQYTADWRIHADEHEQKEHSVARLTRQWTESQAILGAGGIDLYQVHSATLESGILENATVLTKMAEIKESGTAIGVSVSGPGQADVIDRLLEVQMDGELLFDTVQATWNLLEISTGPALARAHDAGLGVIVKEGVANGRLTLRNPNLIALAQAARKLDLTPDALALAAVLENDWADVVLSGAATPVQLVANLKALELYDGDGTAGLDWASLVSPMMPARYWSERADMPWS
ncbi:MAG: aldo/keto reductase [Alphaproteobacteria bacterium]|nr:aldo/keto reductase [Alphaproteobacteria bacterium]